MPNEKEIKEKEEKEVQGLKAKCEAQLKVTKIIAQRVTSKLNDVVEREKDIVRREASLADREKRVKYREEKVAEREAKIFGRR
jgi:hypothetical protein